MRIVLVFVLALTADKCLAQATQPSPLIPPLEAGGWKLTSEGHVRAGVSTEKVIDDNKHADVYEIRPTLTLETPHEPLSAFFEFELAHLGEGEEDWLVQAYADYKIGDEWLIRAGRLYTSASFFTSPPPLDLETAPYPREPWG